VWFGFEEIVNRGGAERVVRGEEREEREMERVVGKSAEENARATGDRNRRKTFSRRTLRLL
jgi:hypothetical protein